MAPPSRRALVASLVAIVGSAAGVAGIVGASVGVAGLGHLYLREWRRGFAWFALVGGSDLVLTSLLADPTTVTPETLPLGVTLPVLTLFSMSVFDTYYVARRSAADDGDEAGPTCPSCGGAVDPSLDFCHWCTRSLTVETRADAET